MPTISFDGLLIVAGVALAAPLALRLFPRIRLPAIVLEIVLGIVRSDLKCWAGFRSTRRSRS